MLATSLHIFKNTRYALLAASASFLFFTVALWLPNSALIGRFLFSESQNFIQKTHFLGTLYGLVLSSHTVPSAMLAALIAVLSGANVAILLYYIRRVKKASAGIRRTSVASLSGLLIGFLGIGCAACGSVIAVSFLALFGASGLLIWLPFGGAEFGFLAVGLLVGTNYSLLKHIKDPLICRS